MCIPSGYFPDTDKQPHSGAWLHWLTFNLNSILFIKTPENHKLQCPDVKQRATPSVLRPAIQVRSNSEPKKREEQTTAHVGHTYIHSHDSPKTCGHLLSSFGHDTSNHDAFWFHPTKSEISDTWTSVWHHSIIQAYWSIKSKYYFLMLPVCVFISRARLTCTKMKD